MNLKLVKALFVPAFVFLVLCNETKQSDVINATRIGTESTARIMKAFLMQCPHNFSSRNNVQVRVQIAMHTSTIKNTDSFVGKILLAELFDLNRRLACDLKAPSLVEVSNENYVLMYPLKIENTLQAIKETSGAVKTFYSNEAKADTNFNRIETDEDVHSGNNVKLLDDIYYTGLKPSDFFKRSDFMHTNPKDFRRDSICTKNFPKNNNKNNANNEYANEVFYDDRNQQENENAFPRKLGMNLNNNEIDNIMSNKRMKSDSEYSMGHLTKNLFDDMDAWKRRKKIQEHKNEFIKCVGMKNFKKIDHVLCTCARNVDEVYDDVDETANGDTEQSDCFQLINNVCPLGPVYSKNINYETKMNDDIRNVNYGNIKSTAFACCDLLPPFYFALGKRCYNILGINDLYVDTDNKWIRISNSKILDELPEIIKSDDVVDEKTSYLRSNIEKDEQIIENKIHRSDSSVQAPKYMKEISSDRLTNSQSVPFYDTVDAIVNIAKKPMALRHYYKKEAKPFDKDIYDPHLNIADKMQLINMINPKRPCERNRMKNEHSLRKRNFDPTDQIASLTDDELDSALEDYEYSDAKLQENPKKFSNIRNTSAHPRNESLKKIQKVCSQHPCALALPFKKDPYYHGEIHFLDNNGSKLNSHQIAENICRDHFNEFILIPFDYEEK
ncbi:uncharacterized protein MAL13P1.304-like [Bradysia coprophila]|uniref:uncharacterized protein MAL13P1.304-like n=1 Tax=Bradysia coprophila TaxID=38358 RepID=UPI00187D9D40|nr:uncharacterized protein MAL13P1.304-like [Bradysia coprophila]